MRALGRPAYQVAGAAGLKDWQLSDYLHGRKEPSLIHVRRICAALGVDVETIAEPWWTIAGGSGEPPS